ncbi:baseplate J/gp47 family protein [Virgibacillus sediminis]|uniref:Baseplate J/gp47 family protein n=1 Tax=Virgibacillus sediminis TaxID=202260 RepID=A0ABV7A6J7_9BACI
MLWKDNEDVYYSAYPSTATGVQLDRILPYAGIRRNPATRAIGTIQLAGTANYTVPAGFAVATDTDIFFLTTNDITLDSNGTGTGTIVAQSPGEQGNVGANVITVIVNPDANIDSVTNPEATEGGREKETTQEARERFYASREGLGSRTEPSIRSAILDVPDVRAVYVKNNPSNTTDPYGTPPKSYQTFVLGGSDAGVAQAILNTGSLGIQPYGTTQVILKDDSDNDQVIGFTRATEVPIYVRVTVTKNSLFPADGVEKIKSSIIRYIGGENKSGSVYTGLNMGDTVTLSRLIARAYQVEGIEDIYIEISKDGVTYSDTNISIDILEVAQVNHADIEVAVNV